MTCTDELLSVRTRFGFHFCDALILAGAIEYGCSRSLTEDLQHGQRVEGVLVWNLFIG
ncbi:MAG: hypothetical protein KIS66_17520 [Fimbriimonadaceae bacterium]|nr:hypothetical protein [Fimbriimonadaceae bacterium]